MFRVPACVLVLTLGLSSLAVGQVPTGTDPAYVSWLEERSLLAQSRKQAAALSGRADQWRHRYGDPRPRAAVRRASVWLLDYSGSVIPTPGKSVVATWADPDRWHLLREVGIDLLHTGPVERAGGVAGREFTPSTDGGFDPISGEIDPQLGTAGEFRRLVKVAGEHGGVVGGSLVPLHTGTGPDFRLATMAHREYPGLYTLVEVRRDDWPLLPKVGGPWVSELVPVDAARSLSEKGYIPGPIHSNDAAPQAKQWSGWSATGEVPGVDGKTRRWVYLHSFKPSQPVLNWLDPSFAAQRAVGGQAVHLVHDFGLRVVRLDAVPFLGLEHEPGKDQARHFKHPLSVVGTNTLAMLIRKSGGFTFHELNVSLTDLKTYTRFGPDLSYDFVTRAQILHAVLTGDAGPLRLAFRMLHEAGADPGAMVHDLQNHDEITYQLVELDEPKDATVTVNGEKVTRKELKERLLREMREKAAGEAGPLNRLYRPEKDGIATTFAGFVAAGLGVRDPGHATAEQREQIKRAHLLLVAANALQPGVFSLSAWDLVGALPVPEEAVKDRVKDGDYRWVNRGAVDLAGAAAGVDRSVWGLPRAPSLYGPLPAQLKDPTSFASSLRGILAARRRTRLAEGELIAVPEPTDPAVCLLVLRLPGRRLAITALNFGRKPVAADVDLSQVAGLTADEYRGRPATDVVSGRGSGAVTDAGRLTIRLDRHAGTTIVIGQPAQE
jgi:maltose alpha-D-glucosyltransferase/alpha-amylase